LDDKGEFMKVGKISEVALSRAVFKQLKSKRDEVLFGGAIGEDCAAMRLGEGEVCVFSSNPVTGAGKIQGALALYSAVNNLVTSGAEAVGVLVTAMLPENFKESRLIELSEMMEEVCQDLRIQVMGGHTEVTAAVNEPVFSVTAVGKVKEHELRHAKNAKADQDIVMSKWIGMEGSVAIVAAREKELMERFPKIMIDQIKKMLPNCSCTLEAALAVKSGVSAMHDISSGGIYGALYELSEAAGVGLEIDLRAIPIKQETVEICEYLGLNPYYLKSGGSMLMVCDHGQELVRLLEKEGIYAAVIGRTTSENAKAIINEGEVSYLERPKADELLRAR
jgi:hydrogenase maturation factor